MHACVRTINYLLALLGREERGLAHVHQLVRDLCACICVFMCILVRSSGGKGKQFRPVHPISHHCCFRSVPFYSVPYVCTYPPGLGHELLIPQVRVEIPSLVELRRNNLRWIAFVLVEPHGLLVYVCVLGGFGVGCMHGYVCIHVGRRGVMVVVNPSDRSDTLISLAYKYIYTRVSQNPTKTHTEGSAAPRRSAAWPSPAPADVAGGGGSSRPIPPPWSVAGAGVGRRREKRTGAAGKRPSVSRPRPAAAVAAGAGAAAAQLPLP